MAGAGRRAGDGRLLFTTVAGKRDHPDAVRPAALASRAEGGGIAKARENGFHALRHHFASTLLYNGVDIRALAVYLGHHDPAFTLRVYARLVPEAAERMRKVIDKAARTEADGPSTAQEVVPGERQASSGAMGS